jgi:hypothetical protein
MEAVTSSQVLKGKMACGNRNTSNGKIDYTCPGSVGAMDKRTRNIYSIHSSFTYINRQETRNNELQRQEAHKIKPREIENGDYPISWYSHP